jgi:uncharacterized OB-fold protein
MSKEQMARAAELPDELTFKAWQAALIDGRILGHECSDCQRVTSFPRWACDNCGERDLTVTTLPSSGMVYSETQVNVAPEGFEGDYRLGLIDLGEAYILGRIEGEAGIGDPVTFSGVFRGADDPAPMFEPDG